MKEKLSVVFPDYEERVGVGGFFLGGWKNKVEACVMRLFIQSGIIAFKPLFFTKEKLIQQIAEKVTVPFFLFFFYFFHYFSAPYYTIYSVE